MIPKEVFHYTKATTALENILFEGKLKIGQFKDTNDPKERGQYFLDSFLNFPSNAGDQEFANLYTKLTDVATRIRNNEWKVLCFSKNHLDLDSGRVSFDENPFLSGGCLPGKWAHYDENHRGVCLKFNRSKLNVQIQTSLLAEECTVCSGDVVYDNQKILDGPNSFFDMDNIHNLNDTEIEEKLKEYFIQYHERIFLVKSKDWENENEFRWLVYSKKDSPEFIPITNVLEEVFVGSDFSEAYYPSLIKFCKELGIPSSKIIWNNGVPYKKSITQP